MKKNIILFITITITILLLFVGCSNGNNSQNDDNSPETNEQTPNDTEEIDGINFATTKLIGTWIVTNEEIYTGTDATYIPNITFNNNGQGIIWKEGETEYAINWTVNQYFYENEMKPGDKNLISIQFVPEPEITNVQFSFDSNYTHITISGLYNNDTRDYSFIYSKQ